MENESKFNGDKKKYSFNKLRRLFGKIIRFFLVFVVLFGLGFYTGAAKPWNKLNLSEMGGEKKVLDNGYILTINTIEQIVQPASDLLTSRYKYKDADIYENYKTIWGKKVPFTTDMTVFTYEGSVGVGIDLLDVKYDIDNENRIISILIPSLKILSNEVDYDSFKYPFKENSIFNAADMNDFTELISTLKKEKENTVLNDEEFMCSARKNAEDVLKGFLTASDATKDYDVIFK